MNVSIIITSFQRPHLLKWQLHSLRYQFMPPDTEVLVFNDGVEDETESICNQYRPFLNIRYFFTGKRNANEPKWRCPGFAINIGAKQATGSMMIISCAEMFVIDRDTVQKMYQTFRSNRNGLIEPYGKEDKQNRFLKFLQTVHKGDEWEQMNYINFYLRTQAQLNTKLPFFMGINREKFIEIGGYDEDFVGNSFDDDDIVSRLLQAGCYHKHISRKVIHLFHPRTLSDPDGRALNLTLYNERRGTIIRNVGREWGVLESQNGQT